MRFQSRAPALLLVLFGVGAGCGGKVATSGSVATGGGVPDAGLDGSRGAPDASIGHETDGGACVDILAEALSTYCEADRDCTAVRTGEVCVGQCDCGDTPVNQTSALEYQMAVAGLSLRDCPCAGYELRCIAHTCTSCGNGYGPGSSTCNSPDGGVTDSTTFPLDSGEGPPDATLPELDAGTPRDAATFPDAGPLPDAPTTGECVFVDPNTFDSTCNDDLDCTVIVTGEVCTGECLCGDYPINTVGLDMYEQDLEGVTLGSCPCPKIPAPQCLESHCVECVGGDASPACKTNGG